MTARPKHTPEPWRMERDTNQHVIRYYLMARQREHPSVVIADHQVYSLPEHGEAGVRQADQEAADVFARIVACVNACAGLNPEAIPALVEAAIDLVCLNSCGLYGEIPEGWPDQTKRVILAARAALAAVKGGAR